MVLSKFLVARVSPGFIRILCAIVLFIATAAPGFAQSQPVDDKWALVIGISHFKDGSMNLKYPAKDASDFAEYLVKNAHFAPDHVKLITDEQATRTRILTEIADKWLPRVARPNDLVVIYISSHGSPSQMDNEGMNYLVAHDTDKEQLFATGLSLQNLSDMVKERVHADRIVLILDACHSGSAKAGPDGKSLVRIGNFDIGQIPIGKGLMVICSSKPNEVSWESKTYQNGVFTRKLIESLQQKGEYTRLSEAFQYLQDQVSTEVQRDRGQVQTPMIRSAWKGDDLVIATKTAKPRPGLADSTPGSTPTTTIAQGASTAVSTGIAGGSALALSPSLTVSGVNTIADKTITLVPRLAVLPITEPAEIKMDSNWKGFAEKDHLDVPKRIVEIGLLGLMERELQAELKKQLKRDDTFVVEFQNDAGAVESDAKTIYRNRQGVDWKSLGKVLQAKYILETKIVNVDIKDTEYGDTIGMRVAAQVINGETGEVVWLLKSRLFSRLTQAHHDDSIFAEMKNYFPREIAKSLSREVVRAITEK